MIEKFFNNLDQRSSEELWSEVFQKTIAVGSVITVEQDGETFKSLPLDQSDLDKTELFSDGRLRISCKSPEDNQPHYFIIPTAGQKPVTNRDMSSVTFSYRTVENPDANMEDAQMSYQTITIQKYISEGAIEKTPVVYHGSVDSSIEEFVPKSAPERPDEEAAIYASPDIKVAKQSMANRFVSNGGVVNGRHFVCIPMTKEEFMEKDLGGYIYELPSETFNPNDGRGFGDTEWVSRQTAIPLRKTFLPSILDALKEENVEVYFIKPNQVEEIKNLQDGDPQMLEYYLDQLPT